MKKKIISRNITEPITNKDLPLLRASFLKTKIEQYSFIPEPELLEGNANMNIGKQYRNGKIILFLPKYEQLNTTQDNNTASNIIWKRAK